MIKKKSNFDNSISVNQISEFLRSRWSNFDISILRPIFSLIAEGNPVPIDQVMKASGSTIQQTMRAVEEGPVNLNSDGKIVSIFGFGFHPSHHQVSIGDVKMYVCCALFGHFLAKLTGRPLIIKSIDKIDKSEVTVKIDPSGQQSYFPDSACASLILPGGLNPKDNVKIGDVFCSHNLHFSNRLNANAYVSNNSERLIVSMKQLHELSLSLAHELWA